LTLLATGVSVGAWSYDKMLNVLSTSKNQIPGQLLQLPAPPALALALLSIVSKEWLFRITKRVGESINSQILIANAW
jgi:divalent metal cation (Fe/Co/Zn/Cd) transporter